MNNWPCFTLGELCDISIGRTPSRSDPRYWGGSNPWATVRELNEGILSETKECISDLAVKTIMPPPVAPGTLLFSFKLSIGKMAVAQVRMHHNEAIAALQIRDNKILDRSFLYYALKNSTHSAEASHAVLGKVLNKSKVENISIPVPPPDEQRRIVDILNRAERIRRLRDAAAAKRRELIPALFLKMFGDPIENPMGWDVQPLGKALRACDYGSSTKASETGEGLPLIRMCNVDVQGHLDTSDLKYVDLSGSDNVKYGLESGDIIFNRTNSKDLVGKTGIWDGRFSAVLASYFIRIRVNRDMVTPLFVWAYFNTPAMKRKLFATARGAIGQANINAKELKAFPLPLPPPTKQQQFGDLVESIIAGGAVAHTAATTATALGAALTSRLFGEAA